MDKRIIQAVAGSGKTTYIINSLTINKETLIITCTNNNKDVLEKRIMKKFGTIPKNIHIYTLFTFLYNVCLKPFESSIYDFSYIKKTNGIIYNVYEQSIRFIGKDKKGHYFSKNNEYYYHRMSKLINENINLFNDFKNSIEKHFDEVYIDEVQDFSANDFDFLINLTKLNIKILAVGDFFQHTYDSSVDGQKNKNIYKDYNLYKERLSKNFVFDENILIKSYRCSSNVVKYISDNLLIDIRSHRTDITLIEEIIDEEDIDKIVNDENIVKLFYQNHYRYKIKNTDNWGNSKGKSFDNVCVVLNKTTYKEFKKETLVNLSGPTKNKLYVAITRSKGNVYFVEEDKIKKYNLL